MQIRLAVGEQDSRYLEHFVTYLERNYMDRLEVSSFTRPETFREMVTRGSFDVILVDEAIWHFRGRIAGIWKNGIFIRDRK